jgi:hypothetical protein
MKTPVLLLLLATLPSALMAQTAPAAPANPAPRAGIIGAPGAAAATDAAPSAADEGETGPDRIVARFFANLQRREVDTAYDQLTRGTKIAERAEEVKTLKAKTKEAINVFGVILGYDLIAKKTVGTRLVSHTYLSLGKEFPLRWRFFFYKAGDAWKLIDIRVDDRLPAMFGEGEEPREQP